VGQGVKHNYIIIIIIIIIT